MKINEPLEVYVHIPFCVKKCNYCDFLSYAAQDEEKEKYVDALLTQIRMVAAGLVPGMDAEDPDFEDREEKFKVSTVYIGGGTPTTLSDNQLKAIMDELFNSFDILPDAEITIEANPRTVDENKLKVLKGAGVNRLSLGLQSSNEEELKCLGRIHSFEDFENSFKMARAAGFTNISVDIMTAIPNQNEEILNNTIDKVLELGPEHISAYSLIIEEDTPFYELYGEMDEPVVGQEMERKLYYLCRDRLKKAGYIQYEISNFAKKGFEAKHNKGYWERKHYFGLGLGASSFFDCYRVTGCESISEYFKNPTAFESVNKLSLNDAMEEFMYLGLRKMEGVSKSEFNDTFSLKAGKSFDDIYKNRVSKLVKDGLLEENGDRLYLTSKGIDYGNFVFSQFLI